MPDKQEDCAGYFHGWCATFKGPICKVCLCCQLCAEAYDYEPGGRCPGCGK